jgi:putative CocE/NonD family hydrolase
MGNKLEVKKETASMLTRDRIRLDADIYRPDSSQQFPVLLMRQPYGRKIASTVVYAHPSWYAAQGYIVVIQDVRGRGTSEGEFELFSQEREDGLAAVNWASQLPGSTGEVGMYGFSYQGMTQLYAAAEKPRALKVLAPSMVAYDLYTDWAYENGAFCLQTNLAWAIQLAAETARLQRDEVAFNILYTASRNLPLYEISPRFSEILRKYAPSNFYYQWLNHPYPDQYWQELSPQKFMEDIDLPMLHIGGWFDPYLRGTLNLYHHITSRSQFPQYLIIGPWAHLPWSRKVGTIDYGKEAASPVDKLQVAWFDYFLKGIDSELLNNPPIYLFEMGSNQWRYFESFPPNNQKIYYLTSNGLASMREDGGKLVESVNSGMLSSDDTLVHDSWRPVPSLGGHATIPAGSFERSMIDCRSDVLTYTSQPLTEDLYIVGAVTVEIYCTADAPSFDLCAVLSEVHSQGNVYNFTQGYIRVNSQELPVNIPLQATCIKITKGKALRLSLSAACFPAYSVNSGTENAGESSWMDAQIITLTVRNDEHHSSKILLTS